MALGREGEFYAVSYDKNGSAIDPDPSLAPRAVPASTHANEVDSLFSVDRRQGRDYILSRNEWVFELRLAFASEVCLDYFEKALMESPPILPAGDGFQQVTLILKRTIPQHPPTQNPTNGTAVSFIFGAMLGRA